MKLTVPTPDETWIPLNDFKNFMISTRGRIKSIDHVSANGRRNKGRIRASHITNRGYQMIKLVGSTGKSYLVHRLVAECFIPNPDNKPQVNHKNGIKTDNRVENLEWCTASENVKHLYSIGGGNPMIGAKGASHHMAKLTKACVNEIRARISSGDSVTSIPKDYGVTHSSICNIKSNRTWVK